MTAIEKLLVDRFTDAIRRAFRPCPLVGPKWFRFKEGPPRRQFEFVAAGKLAKATKMPPDSAVREVLRFLDLSDLDAEVTVSAHGSVLVTLPEAQAGRQT